MAHLRIGSRGSQLALWQAEHVGAALVAAGHSYDITIIHTTGDKILDSPLSKIGGKGLFTKEIETALAAGLVDLAVHSLKDLPTEMPEGFRLAAIGRREDPRDAFLSCRYASFDELPQGAVIGTSSLRRQAQLASLRPDLVFRDLRGNIDTRVRRLEAGDYDAIVLAGAGLKRLGLTAHVRQLLDVEMVCPAAGQGALAIEIRDGDESTYRVISFFNHLESERAVICERALLHGLGGGCQVPIGAHAICDGAKLELQAVCADPHGAQVLRERAVGEDPRAVGEAVARLLLERGAARLVANPTT